MSRYHRPLTFILILIVLCAFTLSSCSQAKGAPMYSGEDRMMAAEAMEGFALEEMAPMASRKAAPSLEAQTPASGTELSAAADLEARKLIKRGSLALRVNDLQSAEKAVGDIVRAAGGYLASTNSRQDEMSLSIRVPQERFESTLEGLGIVGVEISRSQSTEDVTIRYHDLEGRLESKKQLRETFRGYLKTANNINDIMAVETRLNELENEIDSVGSQFRRLANLVDYATIDLRLTLPASASKRHSEGLGERFSGLFSSFGGFLAGLLVVIVGIIIFGIPICAVLLVFWFLLFGRVGILRRVFRAASTRKNEELPTKMLQ